MGGVKDSIRHSTHGECLKSRLTHRYGEETARYVRRPPTLHHLFLSDDPPLFHPLIGSSQLRARRFPYLYPSTAILDITSTLYAYENGADNKFRNVGTKSSDAGRLPKRHNTTFNTWRKFEIKIKVYVFGTGITLAGRVDQNQAVTGPCRLQLYAAQVARYLILTAWHGQR